MNNTYKSIHLVNACISHGLPEPSFIFDGAGLSVIISLDIFTQDILIQKGLPNHLIEILLYAKKSGSISNSIVQNLLGVSKRTATRYLSELDGEYIFRKGDTGKGTVYKLKGS